MKKVISLMLALLLLLGLPLMAAAAELTSCTVTADTVKAAPGEMVTVPIRISGNYGFTNFAVVLKYDHDVLELQSIDTAEGDTPYLCGTLVSTNTAWVDAEGGTHGYIAAASSEAVMGDGILFTATFLVSGDFYGSTEVVPEVQYIRNNAAVFSVFEQINTTVENGVITAIVTGDINGDRILEYDDVMLVYKASVGEAELTEEQLAAADFNGDKVIDERDVEAIYRIYTGG